MARFGVAPRDDREWKPMEIRGSFQKLVSTPSFAPRFDDWFRFRFPENNLSSAPSAHKALWAEHERQLRWKSEELTKAGAVDFVTPEPAGEDAGGGGYLSRLRRNSQNPKGAAAVPTGAGAATKTASRGDKGGGAKAPLVLRSGSTKRLNASGSGQEKGDSTPLQHERPRCDSREERVARF